MGAESESVLRCLGSKRVGEAMGDFFSSAWGICSSFLCFFVCVCLGEQAGYTGQLDNFSGGLL